MAAGQSLIPAWFCDHAPGRGNITTFATAGQLTLTKVYFEVKLLAFAAAGQPCMGIAGSSFILTNPDQLDVSPPSPATAAQAVYVAAKDTTHIVGRGYPGSIPSQGPTTAVNDWLGFAVDSHNSFLWWRNVTHAPAVWYGASGALSPDPVAGLQGFDFDPAVGTAPITGNIYILGGGGDENAPPDGSILLNAGATGFVAAAPSGYVSWNTAAGTTTFNPSDKDSHVTLSGGNLQLTTATIPGANQPTAFCRSTTFVTR